MNTIGYIIRRMKELHRKGRQVEARNGPAKNRTCRKKALTKNSGATDPAPFILELPSIYVGAFPCWKFLKNFKFVVTMG